MHHHHQQQQRQQLTRENATPSKRDQRCTAVPSNATTLRTHLAQSGMNIAWQPPPEEAAALLDTVLVLMRDESTTATTTAIATNRTTGSATDKGAHDVFVDSVVREIVQRERSGVGAAHTSTTASTTTTMAATDHVLAKQTVHTNTLVLELKTMAWFALHCWIGSIRLRDLLMNHLVFCHVGNGNYYQLSGPVLFGQPAVARPLQKTTKTPEINRKTMFYGVPVLVCVAGHQQPSGDVCLRFGLKRTHMLRRPPSISGQELALAVESGSWNTSGESNMSAGKSFHKLGWRWKHCARLLEQLIQRQKQIPYARLVDRYCPIEVKTESADPKSVQALLQCYSSAEQVGNFIRNVLARLLPSDLLGSRHNHRKFYEAVFRFIALRRNETVLLTEFMHGIEVSACPWVWGNVVGDEQTKPKQPPSFSLAASAALKSLLHWIVSGFIVPLLKSTFYITETSAYRNRVFYFRQDLWRKMVSEKANELDKSSMYVRVLKDEAAQILSSRRIGFSEVRFVPKYNGFRLIVNLGRRQPISELDWESASPAQRRHIGVQRQQQQQQEQQKSTSAATTTTSAWAKRVARVLHRKQSAPNHRQFSQQLSPTLPSVNTRLASVFAVLNMEKDMLPKLLGVSAFGMQDVHARLVTFKRELEARNLLGRPLYFATVDVKGSFDSIKQEKLLEIMRQVLRHNDYAVHKYCLVQLQGYRSKRTFGQRAVPFGSNLAQHGDLLHFPDLARLVTQSMRRMSIMQTGAPKVESSETLIKQLYDHVRCNLVMIDKKLYRQREGIAQGSKVSTLLCSFFYGDLETRHLSEFVGRPDEMFVRFVDDYIFVSRDKERVTLLLQKLLDGFPQYGFEANASKTVVNFPVTINGKELYMSDTTTTGCFPWIGLLINQQCLSVKHDWTRLSSTGLSDTLTLPASHACAALKAMLESQIKTRLHPMFVDAALNSIQTSLATVFEIMIVCALKLNAALRDLSARHIVPRVDILIKLTDELFAFHVALLQKCNVFNPHRLSVPSLNWLAARAFVIVLQQLPSQRLKPYLEWLESRMVEAQHQLPMSRFLATEPKHITKQDFEASTLQTTTFLIRSMII